MRVYVAQKGQGKTSLIINRALYSAAQNPIDDVVVVSANQKRSSLVKKKAMEENGGILPKNIDFVGADVLFSKNASRVKKRNLTRFFFDDVDDILKVFLERTYNGKVCMDMATATEEAKTK